MATTQRTKIYLITLGTFALGAVALLVSLSDIGYFAKGVLLGISGGLIGGGLYMARGFYQAIVNRQFDYNRFIWWYLCRPFVSAAAGGIAFVIAFLVLDIQETFKNLPAFFLIGIYAGFNFTAFAEGRLKNSQ